MEATNQLFALVDVNNMYVACERSMNPKLHGRYVCVLSNNDGNVVARSPEVKALKVVKMGTPWHQIKDLVRQYQIIGLSSNYTLYANLSNRFVEVVRRYSPQVEIYSIDEVFLNLKGLVGIWGTPSALGQAMRSEILQWTTLPVCVGIASTKTLAKLANHVAKKFPLFEGVCDFSTMSAGRMAWLFNRIEVDEVWGVGRRIAARLHAMEIHTIQQLKHSDPQEIRAHFGVVMERTVSELRGISCLALEEVTSARKEIVSSRSFGTLVTSIEDLTEAVSVYIARAGEKLRAQESVCGAVHVFVQTNPFRPQDDQYSNGMTVPLIAPSDDNRVLAAAAIAGLRRIYRPHFNYKKAGIMLQDLAPSTHHQTTLFDDAPSRENATRIMGALDSLNQRYGKDTLHLAASGLQPRWAMRSENRTPCYTTRWEDLPCAVAK